MTQCFFETHIPCGAAQLAWVRQNVPTEDSAAFDLLIEDERLLVRDYGGKGDPDKVITFLAKLMKTFETPTAVRFDYRIERERGGLRHISVLIGPSGIQRVVSKLSRNLRKAHR